MFVIISVININGSIMQLGTTITNDSKTVVAPSVTTAIEQGVLQQNSLMVRYYVCQCLT